MKLILYTDGGARGNPGPGAIGVVIKNLKGEVVKEIGKNIGKSTNNEAEYKAIIAGLESCLEKGASELECYLDSQLVVSQLKGEFKVKNTKLKNLWAQTKNIEKNFKEVLYIHIPREKNHLADKIVNEVLDSNNYYDLCKTNPL
ncbi:MAG: ribonuclease HI family protein [Patescibacteria group bacterium]|nr:ribonuclease HI family protein [Patescibacteria group bacterium]MBU1953198.1 ribonuclease HI family protein [Patescibacteria group bacterium]